MRSRLLVSLLTLLLPFAAHAALGGHVDSVKDDQQALKGISRKAQQTSASYSVTEIESAGYTVREYANSDGTIFAVTWRGVGHPDLQTLLGDYYNEFTEADANKESEGKHTPRSIEAKNVTVRRSGHMRDWRGRAFAPKFIPEGVNVEELP